MPNSSGYKEDKTYPVENITPDEFKHIYSSFGYSSALKQDTASLSYVAELSSNLWLLAIDGCLYKEYETKSISAGRIAPPTEKWIVKILDEAKEENIQVISMMHHGLVEHFPLQSTFFPQYLIEDWERLSNLFANNGIKAVFTGHFHANDITEFISDKENKIYDIETGALCSFPFPYRTIEIAKQGMKISTKNIHSIPSNPNLYPEAKKILKNIGYNYALQKIRLKMDNFDNEIISQLADITSELFLLHVQGDEIIDNQLQQKIKIISEESGLPIDNSPEYLQWDFPPADNNIEISF